MDEDELPDATAPALSLLPDGALLLLYPTGQAWRVERDGSLVPCSKAGTPLEAPPSPC
jgi:hypothetical protein